MDSKDTVYIGTKFITTPNAIGRVVAETPKTLEVEVVDVDFSPKTGGTLLTHVFSKGEREWFSSFIGRRCRFWKDSGKEVGGTWWIVGVA